MKATWLAIRVNASGTGGHLGQSETPSKQVELSLFQLEDGSHIDQSFWDSIRADASKKGFSIPAMLPYSGALHGEIKICPAALESIPADCSSED